MWSYQTDLHSNTKKAQKLEKGGYKSIGFIADSRFPWLRGFLGDPL